MNLRELGLNIGDRKRFRRRHLANAAERRPTTSIACARTMRAEGRPPTIVSVDLGRSSGLGERLEPEDLLEVIRRYREFAGVAINRFGGMMGRLIGDGILAYFCYPVATENDPERAVRAALEIVRGIGMLETPAGTALNVHIGIATGRVIMGDLFAGGQQDIHSIISSTPNLAARLRASRRRAASSSPRPTPASAAYSSARTSASAMRGFARAHGAWRVIGEGWAVRLHLRG
jgi:class 3 adenylate cyclase